MATSRKKKAAARPKRRTRHEHTVLVLQGGGALAFGINGFFVPRVPPPYFATDGSSDALSFYDTEPLKRTLEELVDFDLINHHAVRLSVGAVKVRTGDSVYFDNRDDRLERAKDIQYSSKTRFNTKRVRELRALHEVLGRVLERLPATLKDDADVVALRKLCDMGEVTIAHLINRRLSHSAQSKDYEFSRATVNDLWAAGLADIRHAAVNLDFLQPRELGLGMRVYDPTR